MADSFTQTTSAAFSGLVTKQVLARLLESLRAGLVSAPQGAITSEVYTRGHDDTYVLGGVGDLVIPATFTPADEVQSPPIESITEYNFSWGTIEIARSVGWTSRLARTSPLDIPGIIVGLVGRALEESVDTIFHQAWAAAALKSIGAAATTLTSDSIVQGVAYLRATDVPPMPNGDYAFIGSPYAIKDLQTEVGERSWNAAAITGDGNGASKPLQSGLIGRWQGVSFFGSSLWLPVGAATSFTGILTGANAMAFADPSSLQTATVLPQPSIADPTGLRGVSSFTARLGAAAIGRQRRQGDSTVVYNAIKVIGKHNPPAVA
jgi:hypothetical protein